MLHIVQVSSSGVVEAPRLFLDEEQAKAAYVELAKRYWPLSYPEYCGLYGYSPESFLSAEAFSKTFDAGDNNQILYWQVEPENIGSDKIYPFSSEPELLKEQRQLVTHSANDVEQSAHVVFEELKRLLVKIAGLSHKVHGLNDFFSKDQGESAAAELSSPNPMFSPEEPTPSEEKPKAPGWEPFAGGVKGPGGANSDEFRYFPRHDWRQAVYSNLTTFEYWDWVADKVAHCIDKAKKSGYSVSVDPERLGKFYFKTPGGERSEISFDNENFAWCEAHRHLNNLGNS